jgi:O-antigen/teichoic acid export membrane protein
MRSTMNSNPTSSASGASATGSSAGDMLFGTGGRLLYAATRVALPPLALAHMGLAEYGLWAACFVLVSYVGMAASGFTLVYLRRTAQHHAQGDVVAIGRLLSTGMLAMGAFALALLVAFWFALPALLDLFGVAEAQRALARWLWLGTLAVFMADMSLGAFGNVLHAIGRVRQEQKVWVIAFLLEAALIVVLLLAGWGVLGLLAAFAGRYLFSIGANAVLAWRALPGLRLRLRDFDPTLLRGFFGYGAGMQLSGLVATALHSADRLLAGVLLGPQAMALADLAAKLPTTAGSVSSSASMVAVSSAARHDVQGQSAALQQVYRDASRITVASLALALPFLAWFAEPVARAWLGQGDTHAAVAPLLALMAVGTHAHLLTGPVNAVSRGRGSLRADFSYHGLRIFALAAALAVWWMGPARTLPGLVLALVTAQGLAAVVYLAHAHRRLCGAWAGLASRVLAPTLAAYAAAGALHAVLSPAAAGGRAQALAALVLPLLLWVPSVTALLAALLLSGDERRALRQRLLRPRNWRTA